MLKKLWRFFFPEKKKTEHVKEIISEKIMPVPAPVHKEELAKPSKLSKPSKQAIQAIRKPSPDYLTKPRECKRKRIQQIMTWDDSTFPFRWRVKTIYH